MQSPGLLASLKDWLGVRNRPVSRFTVSGVVVTHTGSVRTENQDAAIWINRDAEFSALALVADGMGGHNGGSIASALAVQVIPPVYFSASVDPHTALIEAMTQANREIFAAAQKSPELAGMGTTCVALAVRDDHAWLAWVGDSRLYLLRGGRLYQMSEDHTMVADLVRSGELTQEGARHHEDRNVLSRAIGTHADVTVAHSPTPCPLLAGDRFILCSDGLYDLVPEDDFLSLASRTVELSTAARDLLAAALAGGGYDNISAVLVDVDTAVLGDM